MIRAFHLVAILPDQSSSQVFDAGKGEPSATSTATEARRSSALIGHATLGESDLRFVEDGPPCKVLELPLELASPAPNTATGAGKRRQHAHVRGLHLPAIVLFLERPPLQAKSPSSSLSASASATISVSKSSPNSPVVASMASRSGAMVGASTTVSPSRSMVHVSTTVVNNHDGGAASPSNAGVDQTGATAIMSPTIAAAAAVIHDDGSAAPPKGGEAQTSVRTTSSERSMADVDEDRGGPPPPPSPMASGKIELKALRGGEPAPPSPPLESGKMQLKVLQAWGLAARAKYLNVAVTVRACGRHVGTTRVSAVGGTTSPEWIDEQ